jgi:hypothetical protein
MKTFYLFGEEAVKLYNEEGIESLKKHIKEGNSYAVFVFEEGVTKSYELAESIIGWNDYTILTEQEFNNL